MEIKRVEPKTRETTVSTLSSGATFISTHENFQNATVFIKTDRRSALDVPLYVDLQSGYGHHFPDETLVIPVQITAEARIK